MRIAAAISAIIAATFISAAHADITVNLLGEIATGMKGAAFPKDPKDATWGTLAGRYDETKKEKIVVMLPGGKSIMLPATGRATIKGELGWITYVNVEGPWAGINAAEGIALLDGFLSSNKLKFSEDDQKKWDKWKADKNGNFNATVNPANWVQIETRLSMSGDKASLNLIVEGDPHGKEAVLPAGGVSLPIVVKAISPDSKFATDGNKFFDLDTGKEAGASALPKDSSAISARYSKDGKILAVATSSKKVFFVNTADFTAKEIAVADMPAKPEYVGIIGLSPDAKTLFVRVNDSAMAINPEDGKQRVTFDKMPEQGKAMTLSHDGKTLATTCVRNPGSVDLYNTQTGKLEATLKPTKMPAGLDPMQGNSFGYADEVEFTADDSQLTASGFMGNVMPIYSLKTREVASVLKIADIGTHNVALSPDKKFYLSGTYVASWTPGGVYIYSTATGLPVGGARPLGSNINMTYFSPDGKFVLGVRGDGATVVFKTATLAATKLGGITAGAIGKP